MAEYAVVNNSTVINLILADTLEDAELATGLTCVELNEEVSAGIGSTWDGSVFTHPNQEQ
jgi:hypothetical protein